MNAPIEALELAKKWMEKAEHDLKNAEYTLTLETDCPYDTICFHAQQCVEKYLKALLIHQGIDFPKMHDLTELIILFPAPMMAHFEHLDLAILNPYAVESRYPGDWEPIEKSEASQAVQIAKDIQKIIKRLIP